MLRSLNRLSLGRGDRRDADEPSVADERMKVDDDMEGAQEEAEEAGTWLSEYLGFGVGWLEDGEAFGRVRTAKRTGPSLRWSRRTSSAPAGLHVILTHEYGSSQSLA